MAPPSIGLGIWIGRRSGSSYWTPPSLTSLVVVLNNDNTKTLSVSYTSNGEDGLSWEYSTDGGTNFTQKGTTASGIKTYKATGLTANTSYIWKARPYKAAKYGDYSNAVTKVTYDTNASALFVSSGIDNLSHKALMNQFYIDLKTNGIWTKIHFAYWMVGTHKNHNSILVSKYNLKDPATYTLTPGASAPPILNAGTQFTTSDPAQFDTGYKFDSATRNDRHLCAYGVNETSSAGMIGEAVAANGIVNGIFMKITNLTYCYLNDLNNKTIANTSGGGCIIVTRDQTDKVSIIKDAAIVENEIASVSVANDNGGNIIIGMCNNTRSVGLGYYFSGGTGLSPADALIYSNLITALKTAWSAVATLTNRASYSNYEIEPVYYANAALHIEAQKDNYVFASKTGNLMWSTDSGATFTDTAWADAKLITMAYIFANGNVLFATNKNQLWLGKNSLATIDQKTLKDIGGADYTFHTPANASYPGAYFRMGHVPKPVTINGQELLTWGNWTPFAGDFSVIGATPVLAYYSYDNGETVKVSYRWGQNPSHRDDGSAIGSGVSGNLLGDATNPIYTDHIHAIDYDSVDNCFYMMTGEANRIYWMKGVFDHVNDTWSWTKTVGPDYPDGTCQASAGTRYRTSGIHSVNDYLYILSDAIPVSAELGVYRTTRANLVLCGNHTKVKSLSTTVFPVISSGNKCVCGHLNDNDGATWSIDDGETWNDLATLKTNLTAGNVMVRLMSPNNNGDFAAMFYNFGAVTGLVAQSWWLKFK